MSGKTYNTTKTIKQTLDIFPNLYAVIGMRLHAGILSCVHNIPYIPISYGSKTDELVSSLEIEQLSLKPSDMTFELFEKIWHNFIRNYDKEKENMASKHQIFKKELIKHLETL